MADAVVARLEQAVAKLEQVASKLAAGGGAGAGAPPPLPAGGYGGDDEKAGHPSVAAWTEYYSNSVAPFVATCKKLELAGITAQCEKGWGNIGSLMAAAANAKKPSQEELTKFVGPAIEAITEAGSAPDNRKDNFNHAKAWAECISALGWIMVSPTPQGHIQGSLESADFYLNKVLTANKDASNKADHRAFVKQLKAVLADMKAYVKAWHTTGVSYRGKGPLKAGGGGAAASAPPIPPPAAAAAPSGGGGGGGGGGAGGMGAVFAQINSGGDGITGGLKKVKREDKNKYKPLSERSGLVKAAPKKKAGPSKWAAKKQVVKPPSIKLNRGQWFIEHQPEGRCRVPEGASMKQNVYIFKCGECIVDVPEKVKAITIDGCRKTRIVVNSVVSTVEVVNCQSVIVMTTGLVNSFAIDKTAGCQLWLNKETYDAGPEIITSNISEVNIQIPGADADADPIEMPVPEQFTNRIVGGKVVAEALKHG